MIPSQIPREILYYKSCTSSEIMKHKDQRKEVVFFKLGGAWATTPQRGNYLDEGVLNTGEIYSIEKQLGFFTKKPDYQKLELKLAQKIYEKITKASEKTE